MTEWAVDTEEYRGYTIEIFQATWPPDPREDSKVGFMACWHGHYELGDAQPSCSPIEYMASICDLDTNDMELLAEEWINDEEGLIQGRYDKEIGNAVADAVQYMFHKGFVMLPLHLFDHSGITMSVAPFCCPWDSGQVGFIFAERGFEGMSDEMIEGCLRSEVEEYDNFIRGAVYGYNAIHPDDNEEAGSCWGFYGYDHEKSGLMEQARIDIDNDIHHRRKQRQEQVKVWVRNRVPLEARAEL